MRRQKTCILLLAGACSLPLLCRTASAQNADTTLRNNPSIQGLPSYVLNWETNINRQMMNNLQYGIWNQPRPEPVLRYRNRMNQPVTQEQFIQEIRLPGQRNLPTQRNLP